MGYQSEQELMRDLRDLERKVKAARLRAGEVEDEVRPSVHLNDGQADANADRGSSFVPTA
jgi:hypothetical protein